MSTPIEILKFNLQERQYPYFEDTELELLLESNNNDVLKASWKGCILKSVADDETTIDLIEISSNREYWLGMSDQYRKEYEETQLGNNATGYKISMERADGQ